MNRRNRTILVLSLAVGIAALATWVVYRAISRIPVVAVPTETTFVVAAKTDLPLGTKLTADNLHLVGSSEKFPIKGAFKTVADVVGRGLVQSVVANEPIVGAKLAPAGAGAGLSPTIPPGMRAVSVRVNDVIGVAGYTAPGTRVDVLVTIREGSSSTARTIASNVPVLTAGTARDQALERDGAAFDATVVTLLVSPEDAERIVLAQSAGAIALTLRNPLDAEASTSRGARMTGLMGGSDDAPPPAAPRPAARTARSTPKPAAAPEPQKDYTVQSIKAAKVTEEVVK